MGSFEHYNKHVEEIKNQFYHLTKHQYLQTYLPRPVVDEDKIRFLYAMLNENLSEKDAQLFTLSALLVQAGLDIHEEVSLQDVQSDSLRKKRQLTVLAGDYYVGLYYHMLAKHKHVPLIQVISNTIQEINEVKMNTYENHDRKYEDLEETVSIIETGLMQNIADYFEQGAWKELIKDFFYLKRLVSEKSEWLSGKQTPLLKSIIKDTLQLEDAVGIVEQKVEEVKDRLIRNSKAFISIEAFITWHIDQVSDHAFYENVAKGE